MTVNTYAWTTKLYPVSLGRNTKPQRALTHLFSVLLRVYSDLIASLQHVLNDAGSEKSKSLGAGFFAIVMLFYAISFPTWYNRPPGLPLSP